MSVLSVVATPICTSATECAGQGVGTFLGTPQRIWASMAALLALGAVVMGAVAIGRPAPRSGRRTGDGRRRAAVAALAGGLIAAVNGAVNLAVADGGLGTGNGVFGGALALAFGLAAAVLGGLSLARSRRTAERSAADR
ncbi:DUF6223 family protein [Streptosporangium sp. NPDC048047]|uniref:DUF6223 family protein n=1 Tax=Streptosporangium sp. NPDC048047 TaxID=3155748 RepID=UPI00342E8BC5